MSGSSTLDPDNFPDPGSPARPSGQTARKGNDTGSLGPSDSSDSGSDIAGGTATSAEELGSDSDAAGTGDRAGVGKNEEADDIGFDQTVDASDAGLGTGLDEAELARKEHPDPA